MKTLSIVLALVAFVLALFGIWNPANVWQFFATAALFVILAVIVASQAHARDKAKLTKTWRAENMRDSL